MDTQLTKKDLYESVKTLVELEDKPHIHLCQHKLFTLFSIAFQYMLFRSTKYPGAYIIRIEDSQLADKLAKRAKDPLSRKFLQALLLPRKYKYDNSYFYLDFFHIGSWQLTNNIPKEKIRAALTIKNSSSKPMTEFLTDDPEDMVEGSGSINISDLPEDYYIRFLRESVPKTITIAYNCDFEDTYKVSFPFIKEKEEKAFQGVNISSDVNFDKLEK